MNNTIHMKTPGESNLYVSCLSGTFLFLRHIYRLFNILVQIKARPLISIVFVHISRSCPEHELSMKIHKAVLSLLTFTGISVCWAAQDDVQLRGFVGSMPKRKLGRLYGAVDQIQSNPNTFFDSPTGAAMSYKWYDLGRSRFQCVDVRS
jgi:hypothetical protein